MLDRFQVDKNSDDSTGETADELGEEVNEAPLPGPTGTVFKDFDDKSEDLRDG